MVVDLGGDGNATSTKVVGPNFPIAGKSALEHVNAEMGMAGAAQRDKTGFVAACMTKDRIILILCFGNDPALDFKTRVKRTMQYLSGVMQIVGSPDHIEFDYVDSGLKDIMNPLKGIQCLVENFGMLDIHVKGINFH